VQRLAVGLGEDGDGGDAHLATSTDDSDRDLTAIGNQELGERRRHNGGMIAGLLEPGNDAGAARAPVRHG